MIFSKEELVQSYQKKIEDLLENPLPYPERRFEGQGIVICGGGERYFPGAWVCIKMLRHWGCELPIELWYLGAEEMDAQMIELVTSLNVECVNAYEVAQQYPARTVQGWPLKPYAIMHSRFEEVLLLDADNVPVKDPAFLFSTAPYQEHGSIFWPDIYSSPGCGQHRWLKREAWDVCQVPYRDEAEFETGQLVINKKRCWLPLQLTMHLNEHHDFYYEFFLGDKDTFHLSWRRVGQSYALAPAPVIEGPYLCCFHHDFEGNLLFQHRPETKWTLLIDKNLAVPGFQYRDECLGYLKELNAQWSGKVGQVEADLAPNKKEIFDELVNTQTYDYTWHTSSGEINGIIEFRDDFTAAFDRYCMDLTWEIIQDTNNQTLVALNSRPVTLVRLSKNSDQKWHGRVRVAGMPLIELSPLDWDNLTSQARDNWRLWQKWNLKADYRSNDLNTLERSVCKELTEHALYQYTFRGNLESIPSMPNQGNLLIKSDFTFDFGVDSLKPISWMALEGDDNKVALGVKAFWESRRKSSHVGD